MLTSHLIPRRLFAALLVLTLARISQAADRSPDVTAKNLARYLDELPKN